MLIRADILVRKQAESVGARQKAELVIRLKYFYHWKTYSDLSRMLHTYRPFYSHPPPPPSLSLQFQPLHT